MRIITGLLFLVLFSACSPIRGLLESDFTLSPASRLPVWYPTLPTGYQREDVTIELRYYSPIFDVDDTVLIVKGKHGRTLFEATGRSTNHPQYWEWAQHDWPARAHPGYVNVTINGATEVIEHKKMEPIFYISNEAEVQRTINAEGPPNPALKRDALKRAP